MKEAATSHGYCHCASFSRSLSFFYISFSIPSTQLPHFLSHFTRSRPMTRQSSTMILVQWPALQGGLRNYSTRCYLVPSTFKDRSPIILSLNEIPHCVRNSFVSIYFSTSNSFLPTNTHPPNTCSHFHYDLTTCSPPLISSRFHHSHQVQTVANISKVDSKDLPKTGAIYSQGSSPGTFSHLIPYHKASPIDSLDAHSSTNS